MAVSEGQLAVEFVQALTAEARAHREYLQLLYAVTIGVAGLIAAILVGLGTLFARRGLKDLRRELAAGFEERTQEHISAIELKNTKLLNDIDQKAEEIQASHKEFEKLLRDYKDQYQSTLARFAHTLQDVESLSNQTSESATSINDRLMETLASAKQIENEIREIRATIAQHEQPIRNSLIEISSFSGDNTDLKKAITSSQAKYDSLFDALRAYGAVKPEQDK